MNYIMQVSVIDYMFGVTSVLGSIRACRCEVGLFAVIDSAVAVEFEKASFEQLQEGTRLFLQKHCEGMLNAEKA